MARETTPTENLADSVSSPSDAAKAGTDCLLPASRVPFTEAGLWICEKCGKKLSEQANPALALRDRLRADGAAAGDKGRVRAMISSCMDLCPPRRVTVALVRTAGGAATEFFEIPEASLRPEALETTSRALRQRFSR
jgi:hypothetical protein